MPQSLARQRPGPQTQGHRAEEKERLRDGAGDSPWDGRLVVAEEAPLP